jgi:hypothetical protein
MALPLVITTETILSTSIEIDPYITTAGGAIISIHGAIIGAAVIVITTDGYRLDSMNWANGGRFPPSIAHSNHRCFDGGHCGRAISSRQGEADSLNGLLPFLTWPCVKVQNWHFLPPDWHRKFLVDNSQPMTIAEVAHPDGAWLWRSVDLDDVAIGRLAWMVEDCPNDVRIELVKTKSSADADWT